MNNINSELNLIETETQNINTSLELFEILKQSVDEYCSYVKKYKECTESYFDKLSKLTYNNKKDIPNLNKNLNITTILSILSKVPDLVKQQQEGIKKFVESLDLSIKPLEMVIKSEINSLDESKKVFEESKKKYQKNIAKYKKLLDNLSLTEKKIVKYYIAKKKQKDFSEEKNSMVNTMTETKSLEKDFLEGINGGKNYHWTFQEESLKNIENIKSHLRIILENLNSSILFFLCIFNNCYSPCVNFVDNETKKSNDQAIDIKNLINDNMNIKTYKIEQLHIDKYQSKILNKAKIQNVTYSIDITNVQNFSKFSINNLTNLTYLTNNIKSFFIKDNDDINEDINFSQLNKIDLLGLAKKLYHNFKMIDKSDYDIKSEEEKLNVKNYSDKLLLMKKFKKKDKYNEKITSEEKKKLFALVVKKENREIFLSRLDKIRFFGNFEYPKKIFDDIVKIFKIILDQIEVGKDLYVFEICIILSLTFYYIDKDQKVYIYNFIKTHNIFKSEEMWRSYISFNIEDKIDKFNELQYRMEINDKQRKNELNKEKYDEIIFSQIITITKNMCDFDFDIDKTEIIINEFIKKYNIKKTFIQYIMEIINNKKKENKNNEEDKKE